MARGIFFSCEDVHLTIDFGTYALLMYYSMLTNYPKAQKLFDATLTEWQFRIEYDLPRDSFTSSDIDAHFVPSEIQESIEFIDNEVIPALNNETQDLIVKYGGRDRFSDTINGSADFIGALGIEDDEFYYDAPESLIGIITSLKEFFQYASLVNRQYKIYVH
ncbi:MAG: hypothetical protein P0Y49_14515 [Candidatus Pedobacter colombiensis]|uniref:Uncharacterized protein n=1 Tax=Candidatus Pedobacter colombiensis TaxID=3121371 RepID=A0AAJ5W4V1_9SPHI|nr:hypothetical protein [Pedobacter sp.]WEK18007.1 MAG: hypothetical protein P0Y49_14515 [Pedobacter sp.]